MLNVSFPLRAKTVWNPLRMNTERCRREAGQVVSRSKSLFLWYPFAFNVVIIHEIKTFQEIWKNWILKDFTSIKYTDLAALILLIELINELVILINELMILVIVLVILLNELLILHSCQSVGTVNFALSFTTNVTISISILQTFRFWVATSHLRPPMAFYLTTHPIRQGLLLLWMFILRAVRHSIKPLGQGAFEDAGGFSREYVLRIPSVS